MIACAIVLSGCAAVGPDYRTPELPLAATWQASLPHEGQVTELQNWWTQFHDPALDQLLKAAETTSPTLAKAVALIDQARSSLTTTRASGLPSLNGRGANTRSGSNVTANQSSASVAVDAAWEIDLFGSVRRSTEAAVAQVEQREAQWHDARISLAANVASTYVNLRACEQLLAAYTRNATSQQETARLSTLSMQAGATSPSDNELANAAAYSSESQRVAQETQCTLYVKSLVTLTGLHEPELRTLLDSGPKARLPQPARLKVDSIPAVWVSQRPDLRAEERALAAASANIGSAAAARYPRLSISGTLTAQSSQLGGTTTSTRPWSFGPALSLPLFDGGSGLANERNAQAKYAEALANYDSAVRNAVEEVESTLVNLDSTARRDASAQAAADGYARVLQSVQAQWRAGAVSIPTLEQARRDAITAEISALSLRRDQVLQWINLYKALGGGWQADTPAPVSREYN